MCSNYSDSFTNINFAPVQNDSTVRLHIPADNTTDLKCITVFVINECGNDSICESINNDTIQYINNDCPIIVLPELSCDHKLSSTIDVMSPSSSPVVATVTTSMQLSSVSMVVSDSMQLSSVSMVVSDSVSTGIVI